MGSNQSTQQQDQMSYLAISPSPFVSLVKRSDHGLPDSTRSSSSNRSSKPAHGSVYSSTPYYVGRSGEQKVCDVKFLNKQETSQPDWIPRVVCDHYSSGVSRERQRLTGYLGRDGGVCSNHDCKHPRSEPYGSGGRTCTEVSCSEANMNAVNSGEVNTNEVNTNEVNTNEVNTNEVNTNEVNTTGDFIILHDQHEIIIQDRDRTSDELNSNGAQINRDCSPSHQQHNCVSTNNDMCHNPTDSAGSPVKVGRIPEGNISPRDATERKLVQCCWKKDKAIESGACGFSRQLSVTESCFEEMTEEDQGSGCRDLDSSKEEIQLVERGWSYHEQGNDGDKKTAGDRNLHSQNSASEQETEQGESMNGHDGRIPRGTTDIVLSPENNDNTDHLACCSKFPSQISVVALSNDALSYVSGTSNTAAPNKHDLYSLHLGCSDTSPGEPLTSRPHGQDSSGQLEAYSLSPGTNSICESRLQTAQVYVHPRTGEFHSMVFGSIAGDGTSMSGCSRTFAITQEYAPESHGYSMNHTDMSFGTGSFTCSLQTSTDNSSCDFHPDDRLAVQVGRAGLFDSFRDSVRSCSLDHTTARRQGDQNPEETAQGTKMEKVVVEKQEAPCLESDDSGKDSQARLQTREAISSCESCSIATSSMVPVFGCRSGSLCYKCSSHPQSLAQDTNSFSDIASSHSRSQHSCDSWRDSLQKPVTTQKVSPCFVDYCSDNSEFSAGQLQQRQLQNDCKYETPTANKDRGSMFTGTQEIESCEEATEHYAFNGTAKVSPSILTFGDRCLAFCSNIFKSQRLAENNIRRTDTQAFPNSAVYSNMDSSKQFNSSITRPDNGRHFRRPLGLGGSNPANNSNCARDDDSDSNRSDLDSSRQNRHQKHARCNGQHLEREHSRSEENIVLQEEAMNAEQCLLKIQHSRSEENIVLQEEAMNAEQCLLKIQHSRSEENIVLQEEAMNAEQCLLKIQHSRSLSCDCGDPFKQNYVAYLCCAPEDLSSFGLTFHRTLESWGFRIFIAPRDLELTGPKYDNMARWLEERCNGKIIVILSKNYEISDECLFLTYFARTLDPDSKYRNIIPVMIDKNVEIPNVLKGLSIIKYNYDFRCGWLKKKLVNAIAA